MSNMKNQMTIAAQVFEELVKAVETTQCSIEVETLVHELRTELIELGLDIRR